MSDPCKPDPNVAPEISMTSSLGGIVSLDTHSSCIMYLKRQAAEQEQHNARVMAEQQQREANAANAAARAANVAATRAAYRPMNTVKKNAPASSENTNTTQRQPSKIGKLFTGFMDKAKSKIEEHKAAKGEKEQEFNQMVMDTYDTILSKFTLPYNEVCTPPSFGGGNTNNSANTNNSNNAKAKFAGPQVEVTSDPSEVAAAARNVFLAMVVDGAIPGDIPMIISKEEFSESKRVRAILNDSTIALAAMKVSNATKRITNKLKKQDAEGEQQGGKAATTAEEGFVLCMGYVKKLLKNKKASPFCRVSADSIDDIVTALVSYSAYF